MKSMIPDWLPKLFVKAEGTVREATTKKFSDFQKITDAEGMEVVGLKGGANVRADFPVAGEDYDDTALQEAIAKETQDRIDGDAALQGQIDGLEEYDDTALQEAIAKEAADRAEADKNLQGQIDELAEHHKEPAPEPTREPIYAEDEPTEYPADPPEPLQVDDQWYEVTDPDFDYDNPDPEGLDLYIWTQEGADFKWVLFVPEEVDEYVKKTGDTMTGPLEVDGFVKSKHLQSTKMDSGEDTNLSIQRRGITKLLLSSTETLAYQPVKYNSDYALDHDRHLITKGYVDNSDKHLQAEIDQIALGLETLLVQREHGQWKYVGFTGDNMPRNAGEFSLVSDDLSANDNIITLNQEDLNGKTHGFGDVEVGDYVEIVDLDEPANYVLFVVKKAPEGTGISNVEVSLKDKGQNFLVGETCEIRFFAINEQDLNLTDLDNRYIKNGGETTLSSYTHIYAGSDGKWMNIQATSSGSSGFFVFRDSTGSNIFHVGGDGMIKLKAGRMAEHEDEITTKRYVDSKVSGEGGVIITPLEFLHLSGGQYVSDDEIKGLTAGGSATSGSAHGLDIPWKWFENNYPDIIGWVDDGGQARHAGKPANLTVNKGGSRPGLTVMGIYAQSYADVVIPGFVIRVDKIEEPQWGHKWPEKE